jgi:hypothetical protein
MALSDTDGQELLQVDDIMSGSATLDRVAGGRPATGREQYGLGPKTETVRVAKLDTLLERESLPPPDVIKIDIEGGEYLMLSGAMETLRRFRPRLAIEMHRLDVTRRALALLADLGYHTFAHIRDQGKMTYREIHPSDVDGRTDFYDIHHVVASMDRSLLQEPIPPFSGF